MMISTTQKNSTYAPHSVPNAVYMRFHVLNWHFMTQETRHYNILNGRESDQISRQKIRNISNITKKYVKIQHEHNLLTSKNRFEDRNLKQK